MTKKQNFGEFITTKRVYHKNRFIMCLICKFFVKHVDHSEVKKK